MNSYDLVKTYLDSVGIAVQLVEHPPDLTTQEADDYIEGIPGVRTKTLFLTNKKKTQYYLVIMDDAKTLDMERLRELVKANRLRFASEASLKEELNLPPGVVSPFGLLNNEKRDIAVYIDQEIIGEERMSFHPNTNDKTVFIETQDLLTYFKTLGYDYQVIAL